jgi:hypothetical protein
MLLYITAEDVFGDGAPERPGPRPLHRIPLHRIPETVAGLYDLGLRHHVRPAAMAWPADNGFEPVPDWKLDRLAIRTALFGRERLGVEPGDRVAVVGRLGWLWPVVDFAAMGFGAVAVGLEHDLADAVLVDILGQANARAIFATDPESAERLKRLHGEGRLGEATLVGEGLPEEERLLPLARLQELGSILDTAERAQGFRAVSRQIDPQSEAYWHAGPEGLARLTHREAMERVEPWLRAYPSVDGDVAYLEGPRVDLGTRLAVAGFVGDGVTTTALGRDGRADADVAELRPHKMIVPGDWLEAACRGQGPRWPAGLDRPWARRRLLERLGGRVRWIATTSGVAAETARALDAAGVTHDLMDTGAAGSGHKTDTVH